MHTQAINVTYVGVCFNTHTLPQMAQGRAEVGVCLNTQGHKGE